MFFYVWIGEKVVNSNRTMLVAVLTETSKGNKWSFFYWSKHIYFSFTCCVNWTCKIPSSALLFKNSPNIMFISFSLLFICVHEEKRLFCVLQILPAFSVFLSGNQLGNWPQGRSEKHPTICWVFLWKVCVCVWKGSNKKGYVFCTGV